eukprot:7791716-Pyramimonas_sp.AAC.1
MRSGKIRPRPQGTSNGGERRRRGRGGVGIAEQEKSGEKEERAGRTDAKNGGPTPLKEIRAELR